MSNKNYEINEIIDKFNNLPKEYQIKALIDFKNILENYEEKHMHDKILNHCIKNGHVFSDWKTNNYNDQKSRYCLKCGFKEIVLQNPPQSNKKII